MSYSNNIIFYKYSLNTSPDSFLWICIYTSFLFHQWSGCTGVSKSKNWTEARLLLLFSSLPFFPRLLLMKYIQGICVYTLINWLFNRLKILFIINKLKMILFIWIVLSFLHSFSSQLFRKNGIPKCSAIWDVSVFFSDYFTPVIWDLMASSEVW